MADEQIMKSDRDKKYHQVVYVKDTKDGPGHASTSIIKSSGKGNKVNHTSFYPSNFGALPNAITLGSVPVKGQIKNDHENDLKEADHILVKEISKDDYKQAKATQSKFSEKVEKGYHLYSIFGEHNPLATAATKFYHAHNNSNATHEKHHDLEGCFPAEDHLGISVYPNHHHVYGKKPKIHNCVTSTQKILNAANVPISYPFLPTNFTAPLTDEHGFEKIDAEKFKRNFS